MIGASHRVAACALGLGVGAVAHVSPPLALLALAALGARALAHSTMERAPMFSWGVAVASACAIGSLFGLAAGIGAAFVWRIGADAAFSMRESARLTALTGGHDGAFARAHLWLVPLLGLLIVALTAPHAVLGLPLDLPHPPAFMVLALALCTGVALIDWITRRAAEWRLGHLARAPALQQACAHIMFIAAYVSGADVSAGLAALIAWRLALAQPALRAQPSLTAVP